MPHVLVEYSSNLEDAVSVRKLIDDLHITMIESALFDLSAIRTRALPRTIYRIADGKSENLFLHIITRIRSGRTVDERKRLGNALLATAKKALANDSRPIALGVEIHEIDPEMLFRHMTIE